jgi:hypothetical protein
MVKKNLNLLGRLAKDRVSGFKGIITSISFDLYGCIQALVHPGCDKDNKILEQRWFDVSRLEISKGKPVMTRPSFVVDTGPAEKPGFTKV